MKKLFVVFATLLVSLTVHATDFKEGENYDVLALPHSSTPSVTEYFSFYCPHCNAFEPIVEELAKQLPKGTEFTRNHVSFLGGNMAHSMSKAYATMISLGVEDKMIPVMFKQIHQLRKSPQSDAELKQIFTDHGIKAEDFDDAFNSFAVDSMVRRFDKGFEEAGLTGVPSIIVNNKYLVKTTSNMTKETYFELVNYLLKK